MHLDLKHKAPLALPTMILRHTEEQSAILNQISSFRVLASAGSGKTSTMAYYVKGEIESKRCQEQEICFITFTRFAAKQIRDRVSKILNRRTQLTYGTFHATMWKLLIQAGLIQNNEKGLFDACMDKGVHRFISYMRAREAKLVTILKKYKLMIVDEFQDLDEIQFEFVKLFKSIQPSLRIVAIGDLAQNIYRFRGTSNEFLRTKLLEIEPGLASFKLTTNFRSTPAILNFVNVLFSYEIRDGHILPMCAPVGKATGMKPKFYEYAKNPGKGVGEYEELVVETLIPILIKAKRDGSSVALIFPVLKCVSYNYIGALLFEKSKKYGFSPDFHQITKEDETCATIEFTYNPSDKDSPIQKSTIHSSKGLEWDIVALVNISDSLYDMRNEEDSEAFIAEKTNLLYVGVTRAAKELYIFGDANCGGRHRLFARLGDKLADAVDITQWGVEQKEWAEPKLRPIGVRDLIRKLPQHPDLFARVRAVIENIKAESHEGISIYRGDVYTEMKKRNRELSFGTFIDWKIKKELCTSKTIQESILELKKETSTTKNDSCESRLLRLARLSMMFAQEDLSRYVLASRYLGSSAGRLFMVDNLSRIYRDVEYILMRTNDYKVKGLMEEYMISQTLNFYKNSIVSEIQAVAAPENSYQGLPKGFVIFMERNMEGLCDNVKLCLKAVGDGWEDLKGDCPLESKSLIIGEADLVSKNMLMEIKCGTSTEAGDLRDSGNCKNLLQVLAYAALGRHGEIPLETRWASLLNPLTCAWEIYDLDSWTREQSGEYMACLEELRMRI